jgi:WD40 repeat protein
MAFSPDGRRLAFGDTLGFVRIGDWDPLIMLRRATQFRDTHLSAVNAVAFSPSGRLLASAGADGLIRVFRAAQPTDGAIAVLEGHRGGVESLVFADETVLYSGGADRTIRIWPLRMDAVATLLCRIGSGQVMQARASETLRSVLGDNTALDRAGFPINACEALSADSSARSLTGERRAR